MSTQRVRFVLLAAVGVLLGSCTPVQSTSASPETVPSREIRVLREGRDQVIFTVHEFSPRDGVLCYGAHVSVSCFSTGEFTLRSRR